MTGKTCACFLSRNLAAQAHLDFALLPLSEALGSDERKKGAAGPKMLFQPGLPGLPGGKGIAVEEGGEARVSQTRAKSFRRGRVRPRIAQKDVVAAHFAAHGAIIHNRRSGSRLSPVPEDPANRYLPLASVSSPNGGTSTKVPINRNSA